MSEHAPVFSSELRAMIADTIDAHLNPVRRAHRWTVLIHAVNENRTSYISNVDSETVIGMISQNLYGKRKMPHERSMIDRLFRAGENVRRLLKTRSGLEYTGYLLLIWPLDAKFNNGTALVTNVRDYAVDEFLEHALDHFTTASTEVAGHA